MGDEKATAVSEGVALTNWATLRRPKTMDPVLDNILKINECISRDLS